MFPSIFKRFATFRCTSFASHFSSNISSETSVENELNKPSSSQSNDPNFSQGRGEKGINMVILMGRVGRDPEIRGSTEHQVAIFPMATTDNFKTTDGNWTQRTHWHRITAFRPGLRDYIARNIRKGDKVHITGSLIYRQIQLPGKGDDQQTTSIASIVADDIVNLTWNAFKGQTKEREESNS